MGNNMGSPAGYYEFKEDDGTWRPCKSSAEIADALANGMSELNLGKHKIVLDSTPMKQINLKTQKERELRFVAVQWVQWQTSDVHEWPRTWTDLPPDESGAVEEGFKGGKRHHYTASFSYGAASPQPASPQPASPEPEAPRLSAPEAGLPRARGLVVCACRLPAMHGAQEGRGQAPHLGDPPAGGPLAPAGDPRLEILAHADAPAGLRRIRPPDGRRRGRARRHPPVRRVLDGQAADAGRLAH